MDETSPAALDIDAIVHRAAELTAEHYLFADIGTRCAERLLARLEAGSYADADADALATSMTDDLQDVAGDRHLRVKHHLDPLPDLADPVAGAALYDAMARDNLGGVRRLERLGGNVGLLEITPLLYPVSSVGQALTAAMNILATASALILDLRANTGGDPGCVALLCTYLLDGEPTQLNSMVPRDHDRATQSWTLPWVPGPSFGGVKPIWVLTSNRTFSGGEELAYDLQQLGRATVVGETTGGGANAREGFVLHPHLELAVPVVAARNPISGANWEGVGVVPDVPVSADDALPVAHGLALEALERDATISPTLRREIVGQRQT